jgi:hypothetical protein
MDKLERMRNRLHILQTKVGNLTPGEKLYVEYLLEQLTTPT